MTNFPYEEIINMPRHVSKNHKPASIHDRSARFTPFAAITGYDALVDETSRTVDIKRELSESAKEEINNKLQFLINTPESFATFTYFVKDSKKTGGSYLTAYGFIDKFDDINNTVLLSTGNQFFVEDIYEIM